MFEPSVGDAVEQGPGSVGVGGGEEGLELVGVVSFDFGHFEVAGDGAGDDGQPVVGSLGEPLVDVGGWDGVGGPVFPGDGWGFGGVCAGGDGVDVVLVEGVGGVVEGVHGGVGSPLLSWPGCVFIGGW